MSSLLSVLFFLVIAYNSYQTAKRSGQWNWREFFIVVVALIAFPLVVVVPLFHLQWTTDNPALATLIAEVVIMLSVCAGLFSA